MKKVHVTCPLCRGRDLEECPTVAFRRTVGDRVTVYCCERLAEKDKQGC